MDTKEIIQGDVLVIGNGYDRLRGLKSDYVSFVEDYFQNDWKKRNIKWDCMVIFNNYLIQHLFNIQASKMRFEEKQLSEEMLRERYKFQCDTIFRAVDNDSPESANELKTVARLLLDMKGSLPLLELGDCMDFNYFSRIHSKIAKKHAYTITIGEKDWGTNTKALLIFLLACLKGWAICKNAYKDNVATEYIDQSGQWVELERIIKAIAEEDIPVIDFKCEISNFSLFTNNFYFSGNCIKPIYYFKETFIDYLTKLAYKSKYKCENEFPFQSILSFNYISPCPVQEHSLNFNVYHVHGHVDDHDKCVFGYDDYFDLSENAKERKENRNKRKYRLSKQFQLLELNRDKPPMEIKKVDHIYIIGHSIGEQDYQYFFTLLDSNSRRIQITIYWYKYKNNMGEEIDNYETMKKNVFLMLREYENRRGRAIVDKMMFERRISIVPYMLGQGFAIQY